RTPPSFLPVFATVVKLRYNDMSELRKSEFQVRSCCKSAIKSGKSARLWKCVFRARPKGGGGRLPPTVQGYDFVITRGDFSRLARRARLGALQASAGEGARIPLKAQRLIANIAVNFM